MDSFEQILFNGRVGATARSMDYSGGKRKFDSLVRKKQADGYEETKVLNNTNVAKNLDKDNLSTIAKRDMLQSVDKTQLSILESLINKLSNIKHIPKNTAIILAAF